MNLHTPGLGAFDPSAALFTSFLVAAVMLALSSYQLAKTDY
jgi:hypothetical protein